MIDADVIGAAVAQARRENLEALDGVSFVRWEEGRSAQLLHIGPYAAEAPSLRQPVEPTSL